MTAAPRTTAKIAIEVNLPTPTANPAGAPRAIVTAIDIDSGTGWLSGLVTIGDKTVPFTYSDDRELSLEVNIYNGMDPKANLAPLLPEGTDVNAYRADLYAIIDKIDEALSTARSIFVDQIAAEVIAAANA